MQESKRIVRLKERVIKELPFFPNDRETLNELRSQRLSDVVIHYLHWKTRLVPTRKRKVLISPTVTSDHRWKLHKSSIEALLEKARCGDDLHPHLSERAHKKGYTPLKRIQNGEADSWDDKDQLLNTTGFHHFHLDMRMKGDGMSERTDDVLFAQVTRESFHAIGIFDHSIFESSDPSSTTAERARMWQVHEEHVTAGMKPGTVYISNPIMTSGHPLYLIRMCDFYTTIIKDIDPKLDDRTYVNSLYEQGNKAPPAKFSFEWHFDGLDLGMLDKKNKVFFNLHKGHI